MFWSKLLTNSMLKNFFPLIFSSDFWFDQTDCPISPAGNVWRAKNEYKELLYRIWNQITKGNKWLEWEPGATRFVTNLLQILYNCLKWFSYIINDDFRISYMICSTLNIVSYQYFMIDMTNFVVFAIDFDFDRSELYIILIVLT